MSNKVASITQIPEPPLSRFLFSDTRLAVLWLVFRLYLAYEWINAGWGKVISPVWTGQQSGVALKGFLLGALKKTTGEHPDVSSLYGAFLNTFVLHHLVLISHLVAYGEVLVGICLLLGIFTGIAAFLGAFMNMNYLFAGTVSINPLMFLCELILLLAWRTAGFWGLDRFVLPLLGTPWYPGKLFKR